MDNNSIKRLFRTSSDSSVDSVDIKEVTTTSNEEKSVFNSKKYNIEVLLWERKILGIAHQLWPAANFLCDYMEESMFKHVDVQSLSSESTGNLNILELGAGVGLCGIFIAALLQKKFPNLYSHIILTDLSEAIEGLDYNINLNKSSFESGKIFIESSVLCWGDDEVANLILIKFSSPPLVIASDCIYYECLFEPFLKTLLVLINSGCKVIISHVKRWKKDSKFFAMCKKHNLVVEIVFENTNYSIENNFLFDVSQKNKEIKKIYCISKKII
jgi:hypothetical protein